MSSNIAISGLNAINQQLDAISNNIANSGTVGFKSGRAEFASLYAEGQPLGVGVTGVTESISKGGNVFSSGNSTDLAITGGGFFMLHDSTGATVYTRAGYMQADKNGYLVNNQGMKLQGYPVDSNNQLQTGVVSDLKVSSGSIPAKASSNVNISANLDADAPLPANSPFDPSDINSYNNTSATQVYDSLGREHTVNQYYVNEGGNNWTAYYYMDGNALSPASQALTFSNSGVLTGTTTASLTIPVTDAAPLDLTIDYTGTTQFGSDFSLSQNKSDGYASGERTGLSIDEDGSVYATFSNNQRMLQGQIVLADFANPTGLESANGTTWVQTQSSGAPIIGTPGTGLNGSLTAGALESSNVDLTTELVNLMSAQQNYQANTKVISTNDKMMSALMQAV